MQKLFSTIILFLAISFQLSANNELKSNKLAAIIDSIYFWSWDAVNNNWANKPYQKTTNIVYDANYNITSELQQSWNGIAWMKYYKFNYTYNSKDSLTNEIQQYWNGTSWLSAQQFTYTFDANNNKTSELDQSWNGIQWINSKLFTYNYNTNNKDTLEIDQIWNGTGWDGKHKWDYTYDKNNDLTYEYDGDCNGDCWGAFLPGQQINYTYDSNHNMISLFEQVFNFVQIDWNDYLKGSYTYNSHNNIISGSEQIRLNKAWVNSMKYTYTYNANNDELTKKTQAWDGSSTWLNYMLDSYTYDANYFELSYAHKDWNANGSKVAGGDSIHYYFHTVVTGVNELGIRNEELGINIFPNPATNNLTIESTQQALIEIYNMQGKLMKSITACANITNIDVSAFPRGAYVVEVKTVNGIIRNFPIILSK